MMSCIAGFNTFQVGLIVVQQCCKLAAPFVDCLTPTIAFRFCKWIYVFWLFAYCWLILKQQQPSLVLCHLKILLQFMSFENCLSSVELLPVAHCASIDLVISATRRLTNMLLFCRWTNLLLHWLGKWELIFFFVDYRRASLSWGRWASAILGSGTNSTSRYFSSCLLLCIMNFVTF
jgi:hypothetical protein